MKSLHNHPVVYFFTPFCLLRNTTNRIFDVRMAAAFHDAHCPTTIVFPFMHMPQNMPLRMLQQRYAAPAGLRFRMLFTPLSEKMPGVMAWPVIQLAFFLASLRILLSHAGNLRNLVIVSRDIPVVLPLLLMKKLLGPLLPVRVVPQLHELKPGPMKKFGYRAASGLMVNVPPAKENLVADGIPPEKILVMNAPMVDFSKTDVTKDEARRKIRYHDDAPLVVYTGKISKKAHELLYLLDAAAQLPDCQFMLTGGKPRNIEILKGYVKEKNLENVSFTGFLDDVADVRLYQLAADVLVSYYTAADHLVEYNYPQKLQEYLSTGNPVVTPLFDATREVVNGDNVIAVRPDDPMALAAGIREAIQNPEAAGTRAAAAKEASRMVTYDYKVREFLTYFGSLGRR